ncbi:unnamed protein product [Durusdinium trenchii]|uniref:peptidylprolyl isomerase n=1 Tax=Durusdinium trenchii TaxID=1381693 RepID=A0ABP0SD81_9DINO
MIRRRQFASLLLTLAVAVLCRSHLEFVTVPDGPRVRRRLLLNVASWAPAAPIYARGQGLDLSFLDPKAPPDVSAPPKDAELLPSGLATKMLLRPTCALSKSIPLTNPDCERPQAYDKVLIDYTGWTPNGKMIDSSRNEKRLVRVDSVMKGWTEGLQMMAPGESRRFWIPPDLAFGSNETATTKPTGPLVFDIELYSIQRQPKPPAELSAPPNDAAAPSGLGVACWMCGKIQSRSCTWSLRCCFFAEPR